MPMARREIVARACHGEAKPPVRYEANHLPASRGICRVLSAANQRAASSFRSVSINAVKQLAALFIFRRG